MSIYDDISQSLQKGRVKLVQQYVGQAVDDGLPAQEILDKGLLEGMNIIGAKFKNNEVYVPEVIIAARAMKAGTELLKPLLVSDGVKSVGRVCIGTVMGDMHDIGKNLVKMMMEGKGLEVIDLGTDVAPEKFIETAVNEHCSVVACSALLTTTMCVMHEVVEAFISAGLRGKVKIMVGGAPVTQDFCDEIGADSYTPDAASAAEAAVNFFKT
jgi:corrinoid protein of di/trimethylamine methyltransferase